MKTYQKKSKVKKILVLIISLAFASAVVLSLNYYRQTSSRPQEQTSSKPTKEQKQEQVKTEQDAKKQFAEGTKDQELPGINPPAPSSSDSIEITTTQDKGTVTISTKLRGFSAGTCSLAITNDTETISETADILYQPEYSTCAGFSILKTRLSPGTWNISLSATHQGEGNITKNTSFVVK